mmetsp:Transcript_31940/g.67954  ORF Transcript_31940/g.67954 Transcript_31940/m.67954 type:complete len:156 (-) Transcript_31940:299-766(-)
MTRHSQTMCQRKIQHIGRSRKDQLTTARQREKKGPDYESRKVGMFGGIIMSQKDKDGRRVPYRVAAGRTVNAGNLAPKHVYGGAVHHYTRAHNWQSSEEEQFEASPPDTEVEIEGARELEAEEEEEEEHAEEVGVTVQVEGGGDEAAEGEEGEVP